MNINQLRYVLEVASSSSMREASTKLYITQPALSSSIKELEQELGITIFERTNKGISLSTEGREFVTYAKKAVSQYEILEDKYLSSDGHKERFSVSTQHYNFAIKTFTKVIEKTDPERYEFSIRETKTEDVLNDVSDLKSEIGIISFSSSNESIIKKLFKDLYLEFTPLMIRDTYIYLWKDHPFADRKELSIDDMKDYPCVSFDQTNEGNFYISEEALADRSFDKAIKTDDRATTLEIIAETGGYSIGSGMLSQKDSILRGLVSVKMKEEDPLTIGFIKRKGSLLSKYGEAYVSELLKYKEI